MPSISLAVQFRNLRFTSITKLQCSGKTGVMPGVSIITGMQNIKLKNRTGAVIKRRRVFLVDPFSLVRLSVMRWLDQTSDLVVCGQTDRPAKALRAIRRLRPDIVVTEMFSQKDFKFIQTLHRRHPRLPILVFSVGRETWRAPSALESGADGYLLKGMDAGGLADGIRRALEGRVVLSSNVRYQLLMKCAGALRPRKVRPTRPRPRCGQRTMPLQMFAPVGWTVSLN